MQYEQGGGARQGRERNAGKSFLQGNASSCSCLSADCPDCSRVVPQPCSGIFGTCIEMTRFECPPERVTSGLSSSARSAPRSSRFPPTWRGPTPEAVLKVSSVLVQCHRLSTGGLKELSMAKARQEQMSCRPPVSPTSYTHTLYTGGRGALRSSRVAANLRRAGLLCQCTKNKERTIRQQQSVDVSKGTGARSRCLRRTEMQAKSVETGGQSSKLID